MKKIGITGGIGSGKSTVCRVFAMLGIAIYDSDREAKRLMNSDPRLTEQLRALFGSEAYINGQLNRPFLASVVFNHPERLTQLNALVHPAVAADFAQWTEKQSSPYVIEEPSCSKRELTAIWTKRWPLSPLRCCESNAPASGTIATKQLSMLAWLDR